MRLEPRQSGPAGSDGLLVQSHRFVLGPGQQEICLPLAAPLRGLTVGQRPGLIAAGPGQFPGKLAQQAPAQPLPRADRRCRGRADAVLDLDLRAGHGADPLPVLEFSVSTCRQPEHHAVVLACRLAEDAIAENQVAPVRCSH